MSARMKRTETHDLLEWRESLRRSWYGRALLWFAARVYGLGVWIRHYAYDHGWIKRYKLPARTIVFGNLTTGGTGKTPAVLLAAETLQKKKIPVAILTRGYKRRKSSKDEDATVLDGDEQRAMWRDAGDEAWMLHQSLKSKKIPIVVSSNRVEAGRIALRRFNPRVLLLDDGFQHLRLKRDADIVLVDAKAPWGGGELLPAGNLREPLTGLRRAKAIMITHADQVSEDELAAIRAKIEEIVKRPNLIEAVHSPQFFLDLKNNKRLPLTVLKGEDVAALSALGNPASFEFMLQGLELELKQKWRFPDHHAYTLDEIRSIENVRGDYPLVTTLKDFTKFPDEWRDVVKRPAFAMGIRLKITRGREHWEQCLKI